jgi:hypothetical protein
LEATLKTFVSSADASFSTLVDLIVAAATYIIAG